MTIKILLVFAFVCLVVWIIKSSSGQKVNAYKKIIAIGFLITAITFILNPEAANDLAKKLGVGRGADLLLYTTVLAFLFTTINSYIKSLKEQRRLVQLVRRVALLEAKLDKKGN